jgi:hypothetical protein
MTDAQLSEHESILPASDRGHAIGFLALLTLAGPTSDVITGRAKPTWLAALALAAFVICYAFTIETGQHWRGSWRVISRRRREVHYVAVAALGPIATAAALAYGTNWLVLFIFVAVTAVLTVPTRWAARTDVAVGVVVLVVELTHGWTAANLAAGAGWALAAVVIGYVALLMKRRTVLIRELREAQCEIARLAAADAVAEERLPLCPRPARPARPQSLGDRAEDRARRPAVRGRRRRTSTGGGGRCRADRPPLAGRGARGSERLPPPVAGG